MKIKTNEISVKVSVSKIKATDIFQDFGIMIKSRSKKCTNLMQNTDKHYYRDIKRQLNIYQ